MSEGGDRRIHNMRCAGGDLPVADPEAFGDTGPERFDDHVRGFREPHQRLQPGWLLQIQCQTLLAAAGIRKEHADAVAHLADGASRLTLVYRLDLDHFGTVIGHKLRQHRPGQEARQVDDA